MRCFLFVRIYRVELKYGTLFSPYSIEIRSLDINNFLERFFQKPTGIWNFALSE